ncbi:hypothetical protein I3843_13G156100 [Carya illinoinensis]|nr:hypothetical protein I3843_13G156100 [Carya illinoinensis]
MQSQALLVMKDRYCIHYPRCDKGSHYVYMVITGVVVVHKLKMNVLEMGNEGYGALG